MMDLRNKLLSEKELIQKAAEFKGLHIVSDIDANPYSESLGLYKIEGDFLQVLKENGFSLVKRQDGVTTLSWRRDYWNFRRGDDEFDELALTLHLVMSINQRKRGIVFVPVAHGSFLSPTTGSEVNHEVFKAVVICGKRRNMHPNPLIQQVVNKGGEICVNWGRIQLGGIRLLRTLFAEFKRGRQLNDLLLLRVSIFDPDPSQTGKYLSEELQPQLFQLWEEQLQNFKARI